MTAGIVICAGILACVKPMTVNAMSRKNEKAVISIAKEIQEKYGKKNLTKKKKIKWCAHRGCSNYTPENTEASIMLAGMCGATAVEIDVRITKDGKLVLMHDTTVDRMTNGTGRVDELEYKEISKLKIDGGANAEKFKKLRVCTLAKALKMCKRYGMFVYVELKYERNKKLMKKVVKKTYKTLKTYGMFRKAKIISFSRNILGEWANTDKKKQTRYAPLLRSKCDEDKKTQMREKFTSKKTLNIKGTLVSDESPPEQWIVKKTKSKKVQKKGKK